MLMNSNEYIEIIEAIKGEIRGVQYKAALSVNRELIMLYYHIGTVINQHKTWGSKFVENLAADIRLASPNVKGYSVRGYLKSDVGFFCFRVFEKGGCSKVLCGVFSFRAVRGKAVAVKFFVGFRRRM